MADVRVGFQDTFNIARHATIIIGCTIILIFVKYLYQTVLRPHWYVRHLPGPPNPSYFFGNMAQIRHVGPAAVHGEWHNAYGPTFLSRGIISTSRICTIDKRALHHILITHPHKFPKAHFVRQLLIRALGDGLILVEGADHTRQRRIMNPSFGPAQLKSMFPLFLEKALHLRDVVLQLLVDSPQQPTPLNMFEYASRATLDIIGAAGFGYDINAIQKGNENELVKSFNALIDTRPSLWRLFKAFFPLLGNLPEWSSSAAAVRHARAMVDRVGKGLIIEKKQALFNAAGEEKDSIDSSQMVGKDLLSLLIKANMASDLRPSQRMRNDEVMAQISTFLLAGNDTTATGITWAVYGMCKYPEAQTKLREELLRIDSDSLSYDELNNLPYLDAVVRETLRLYCPVLGTTRVATEDCVIPLGTPIVDNKGVSHTEIFCAKNTALFVPIISINTNTQTWGPDAKEFRPDRWLEPEKLPEGVLEMPSIAFPTFLAGPRGCIGFRFSIIEIKAILFSMLRSVKITLSVDPSDIEGITMVTTRPRVKSRPEEGWQLPILLSPVNPDA